MDASIFDEDYFIRGRASGKSLYENYRYLPSLTIPMVHRIIEHLDIGKDESVLDFGCARGYTVKAFRELGYEAYGVDISEWAIANADEVVATYCFLASQRPPSSWADIDWIIAKDVLEHVPEVSDTIDALMNAAKIGVFAVVPLSFYDGQPYIVQEYEKDITHIHRLSLASWARLFLRPGWKVEASYRMRGVKDNYAEWDWGNGFIIARRL